MKLIPKIFTKKSRFTTEDGIFYTELKNILGFAPHNLEIYKCAFTHRSEHKTDEKGNPINFERLEFLGDAMLGSAITAYLYEQIPTGDEGFLTKMRSKIVSREHLNELGKDFKLTKFLNPAIPLKNFGANVYGNLFEAFIGAIYLDKGNLGVEQFIKQKVIKKYVDLKRLEGKVISYKSMLIEYCQKQKKQYVFEVFEDTTHEKSTVKYFGVKLFIDSKCVAKSRATSKKKAEEVAAQRAYYVLQDHKSMQNFSKSFS